MPLSPKQTSGLQMMLSGASNGAIAKALSIRPETASRWRSLPQFKDALAAAKDPDLTAEGPNIAFIKWRSYDVLISLLESDREDIRLRAASEVFKTWGTSLPPYTGPDQGSPSDDRPTASVQSE